MMTGAIATTRLRRADVLVLAGLLAAGCTARPMAASPAGTTASAGGPLLGAAAPPPSTFGQSLDRPRRVRSGDASITYYPDGYLWVIGNAGFEEQLQLRAQGDGTYRFVRRYLFARDRQIKLDIAEVTGDDSGAEPAQDALGITFDDQPPRLVPVDQRIERLSDGTLYAALHFRDENLPADFVAEVRLRPVHPVVEHRSSVRYTGDSAAHLTRLDAADFVLVSGPQARWRAGTLDNDGNSTFVRLGRDGVLEAETPAQSAARAPVVPLLVLHDATGDEGAFFALRWSTNYLVKASSLGDRRVAIQAGVRMFGDVSLDPRSAVRASPGFDVHPGETITGPWLVLGLFDGGIERGTNVLKRYLMDDRPREPSWASKALPITWNSWFAYGPGVDYDSMRAEAQEAKRLGIEVFYVDYGWSAAQGDWVPHPERFPGRTLRQLSDEVHRLGMRFGLWVAFGVADPDSRLLAEHPDFLARQPLPARSGIDGSRPLCLFRAREWLESELARVVRDYRLDWLKFDQPMLAACRDPSHGHDPSVRGSLQANSQAFYEILSGLRARFPELFIESTFDGAGYLDYGVYARSHAAWLDDAAGDPSVPMPAVQQSLYGATLAFPARFLTLWLARGPVGDGVDGRGTSPDDLRYQGYSTMGGSWGLSLRLVDLDAGQREAVRELISEYLTLRPLLPGADVYHLLPPMIVMPGETQGPVVGDWFALQYQQPELGRGALLVVRNGGGPNQVTLRLHGLQQQVPYRLQRTGEPPLAEERGAALMDRGIDLRLAPYSGCLIWVTPVG